MMEKYIKGKLSEKSTNKVRRIQEEIILDKNTKF